MRVMSPSDEHGRSSDRPEPRASARAAFRPSAPHPSAHGRSLRILGGPKRRLTKWLRRMILCSLVLSVISAANVVILWILFPFPLDRLERWPVSPLVTDRTGREMLCLVGGDEQWRFPVPLEEMSPWLVQATIAVEDERFRGHVGVDPTAVLRATGQNLAARRIVSGASTVTMQVCRMMENRPRTWRAKTVEAFRALQLERRYTKDQILETYLNVAPYGRNLRGVEAAARAYFAKPAKELSLGEAALLAGLPQSPARYRPDRYPDRARARREAVLRRMAELGMITEQQQSIASAEPMPAPVREPRRTAPHAAWLAMQRRPNGARMTIDPDLQLELDAVTARHAAALPPGSDLAAVVIEIASGDVVAMIGSANAADPVDGQVNGALARRSPGSALKPFVYAAAFESKRLAPESIVYDVPIERAGWSPTNFNNRYAGELTAAEALRRSLNVPAILVAESTGLPRCLGLIEAVGIDLPEKVLSRGGLAVVVGAIEVTLLDLVNGYATLGRDGVWQRPRLFMDDPVTTADVVDRNVCAAINDVLSSHRRRPRGAELLSPDQAAWFMWKTGTSSGRRDAWAVGHNRRFAIGVWVGRFSGAGSPEFVGAQVAEPLLARLFQLPAVRVDQPPAPHRPWVVRNPLPPPAELDDTLRITSPGQGATFIAFAGQAIIHPRANRTADTTWFLNGELISNDTRDRLAVRPGRYELRCIEPAGSSSAVTFSVLGHTRRRP